MPDVVVRGAASSGLPYQAAGSYTLALPVTANAGDVILVLPDSDYGVDATASPDADISGFSDPRGDRQVLWGVAAGGETSVTIVKTTTAKQWCSAFVLAGADTTNPVGDSGYLMNPGGSTTTIAGLFEGRDRCLVIARGVAGAAPGGVSLSSTIGSVASSISDSGTFHKRTAAWTVPGGAVGDSQDVTGSTSAGCDVFAVLVTPALQPPVVGLISPADGSYVDVDTGPAASRTFQWIHHDPQGLPQTAWSFRRTHGATVEYWNDSTHAWQSGAVSNTSAANSVTFPTGKWPTLAYQWSVSTTSATTGMSAAFPTGITVNADHGPTTTVTAPANNSTITNTTRPGYSCTVTDPDGDSIHGWDLATYTDAQIVAGTVPFANPAEAVWYDTSPSGGAFTGLTSGVTLDNSTTYHTYIRFYDIHGVPGAAAGTKYTINITPPQTPTIAVTHFDYYGTLEPVITSHDSGSPYTLDSGTIELQHSNDSGTTWQDVRGAAELVTSSGTVSVFDQEIVLGLPVQYRARKTVPASGGGTVTGAWSTPTSDTVIARHWFLTDPVAATQVLYQNPADAWSSDSDEPQTAFAILGRPNKVVVADAGGIKGEEGTLSIAPMDETTAASVKAYRAKQTTLMVRSPAGELLYVRLGKQTKTYSHAPGTNARRLRILSYTFTEVDRP